MKPLISVVMITIGDEKKYVSESMDSFLKQEDVEVQLILSTVDKDKSIKIAENKDIKDIIINKKPNSYKQISKGAKKAKGNWICCAGGNDVALPFKLKDEYNLCKKYDKKICYSALYHTNSNLKILSKALFCDYSYKEHLRGNFVADNALVNTELFMHYMPFKYEFNNYAYWDLWLRICEYEEKDIFVYNNKPNFLYRRQTRKSRRDQKLGNKKLWNKDEMDRREMLSYHNFIYKPIPYELRYGNRRKK